MSVNFFGSYNGLEVREAVLENSTNLISILSFGAITRDWRVDLGSKAIPVVLGFDSIVSYWNDKNFMGIIAGRYANRIDKGKLKVGDFDYQLLLNDYPNHLHGGHFGFGKKNWELDFDSSRCSAQLRYVSSDLEEGYPGKVEVTVTITLSGNVLSYEMTAVPDQATPINLAQHNYYNLMGQGSIWNHKIESVATQFTPVTKNMIPDGRILDTLETSVFNELLDLNFSTQKTILEADFKKQGVDINFALPRNKISSPVMKVVAESGLCLELFTDQPGVQFYSGANIRNGELGHTGTSYKPFDGFCLESQHFPSSVTIPSFPNTIYTPDKPYKQVTRVKISNL
jgi:aldose 1-epimerase